MIYLILIIIILRLFVLFFYTKGIILSIRFKRIYNRIYNIKTSISSVEIIGHIIVYSLSIINISICVWLLFKILWLLNKYEIYRKT